MFPLCSVHGIHNVRLRETDRHAGATGSGTARRGRLILACLTIIAVATIVLSGCSSPDRRASTPAPPSAPTVGADNIPEQVLDELLLDYFTDQFP